MYKRKFNKVKHYSPRSEMWAGRWFSLLYITIGLLKSILVKRKSFQCLGMYKSPRKDAVVIGWLKEVNCVANLV